jgi:hypothetical protein
MPPEIATLFENIRAVYSNHGFNLFTPWRSWPTLNKYYPSPKSLGQGQFIQTDENNYFEKFSSPQGSHPVLGSHSCGGGEKIDENAFQELSELLGLELVLEGKRTRYYKITKSLS